MRKSSIKHLITYNFYMTVKFSTRIKELRIEKGVRQQDIAKIFNISVSTVYCWEAGDVEPSYYMLMKLSKYFDVSSDYILGLEDY